MQRNHRANVCRLFLLSLTLYGHVLSVTAQQDHSNIFSYSDLSKREYHLQLHDQLRKGFNRDLLKHDMWIIHNQKALQITDINSSLDAYDVNNSYRSSYNVNHTGFLPSLSDRNSFSFLGEANAIPGITSLNKVTLGYNSNLSDNWNVNVSSSAVKFRDLTGIHNDFSIDASVYFSITNDLELKLHGGYSIKGVKNVIAGYDMRSPYAPSTSYGGNIEYKISDKLSVGMGMVREYNPWLKRWEKVYYSTLKYHFN